MTVISRGWDRLTLPGKFLFVVVPLLIVQANVALGSNGTVAVLPLLEAQTFCGVLMPPIIERPIGTDFVALRVPQMFATLTERSIGPLSPAVYVMAFVPCPPVMVPFRIVQL